MKSIDHKIIKQDTLFYPDQEDCKLLQTSGLFFLWQVNCTFPYVFTMLDANNQHYVVFTCHGYKEALYHFDRLTHYGFPVEYCFDMSRGGYCKKNDISGSYD